MIRIVLLALLAASSLACERAALAPSERVVSGGPGAVLYLTYCESCHGATGEGNGPAAASLRTPPPDLTRLWERHGTPLDRESLAGYIDGRLLMGFHEEREMPIWGEEFFEHVPEDTPNVEMVRRRLIEVLVEYLETLQTQQPA